MADFGGYDEFGQVESFLQLDTETYWSNAAPTVVTATPMQLVEPEGATLDQTDPGFAPVVSDVAGYQYDALGEFFFHRVWMKPGRIELGNIISSVVRELEIYNSWREEERTLSVAVVTDADGVIFQGLPGLPVDIGEQAGLVFDVVASASGSPEIDGTLDFTLDTGIQKVPITGTRVIMFPFEPEQPIVEVLQGKTNILQAVDGTEQRVQVRRHPRQILNMSYRLVEDDRRRFHTQLFSTQAGVVGLPIWFEGRLLAATAAAAQAVVTVNTSYGDFRVGGLAILWRNANSFEALEIQSLTSSSITFTSNLAASYPPDETIVMPLRLARGQSTAGGGKYLQEMDEYQFLFTVTDNEADLADSSTYGTHDSKIMLDDPNWMGDSEQLQDSITTRATVIDNESAAMVQTSDWNAAQYSSTKGFVTNSPAELWRVRQLIHALRGSQVSFYIPTFYADVVAQASLGSGSSEIQINHIGYSEFVASLAPFGSLWVKLNDGTIITKTVTLAEEIDADTERLTVDSVWGLDIDPAEIDRISFLRLTRMANDETQLEHFHPGTARVVMSTTAVQQ